MLFLSYNLIILVDLITVLLQFHLIVIEYLLVIFNLSFQFGNFICIHIEHLVLESDFLIKFSYFVVMFFSDGYQKLLDTIDTIFITHNFSQILFLGKCGLTGLQLHGLLITDILID